MTDTLAALLVELRSLTDVRAIGLAERIEAEVKEERAVIAEVGRQIGRAADFSRNGQVSSSSARRWAIVLCEIAGGEKPC